MSCPYLGRLAFNQHSFCRFCLCHQLSLTRTPFIFGRVFFRAIIFLSSNSRTSTRVSIKPALPVNRYIGLTLFRSIGFSSCTKLLHLHAGSLRSTMPPSCRLHSRQKNLQYHSNHLPIVCSEQNLSYLPTPAVYVFSSR